MAIEFERVKPSHIRAIEGTPGGRTYFVILPGKRDETSICFRTSHKDKAMRCTNPSGYGTWHPGTGACKFHGGAAVGAIKTGKNSKTTKFRLESQINEYLSMDRTKLLDLSQQLAITRAIFDEFLLKFPEPDTEDYSMYFHRFTELIGTIGTLVEKMSKIDSRNTLTAAQVLYLRATVADILMKYIPEPHVRERAAKELANRMGGDLSVDVQPSEVSLLRVQ